jgi:hypothetical protein
VYPEVCCHGLSFNIKGGSNAGQRYFGAIVGNLSGKIDHDSVLDQFDREVVPAIDPWGPRRGIAVAISQISQFFDLATVESVMQFMVSTGLRDREEIVHKEMLAASLVIIDIHGKDCVTSLLPVFEDFLDKAPNHSCFDLIRQAVVILMCSLARHLDKDDSKVQPIVQRSLAALSTSSQQVQEAVANCIPHLITSVKDQAPQIVKKLLNQLIKSEKYGERRGAAYGIAGVVKGLGILSLKQLDIMSKLTNHIQDKKNYPLAPSKCCVILWEDCLNPTLFMYCLIFCNTSEIHHNTLDKLLTRLSKENYQLMV